MMPEAMAIPVTLQAAFCPRGCRGEASWQPPSPNCPISRSVWTRLSHIEFALVIPVGPFQLRIFHDSISYAGESMTGACARSTGCCLLLPFSGLVHAASHGVVADAKLSKAVKRCFKCLCPWFLWLNWRRRTALLKILTCSV